MNKCFIHKDLHLDRDDRRLQAKSGYSPDFPKKTIQGYVLTIIVYELQPASVFNLLPNYI